MANFSVFGASGFIGKHLCDHLAKHGHRVRAISRGSFPPPRSHLGHAIYCIGLTADFRTKLVETARVHVALLADVIEDYQFDSLLYLSSTRVYAGLARGEEDAPLLVSPTDPDHVYALSKLAGESICLAKGHHVARLSNVIGPEDDSDNFIASLLREARERRRVLLNTSAQSAKDYIYVDDVSGLLMQIALSAKHQVYNVASGTRTENATIAALIAETTGAAVSFAADAATISFPPIDIGRVTADFGFQPTPFREAFIRLRKQPGDLA
jgi:nucleoside-diphosphate-sugar epimerase